MISASHNPFADNGIKLFAAGGRKLTDDGRGAIEAELDASRRRRPTAGPDRRGRRRTADAAAVAELRSTPLVASLDGRRLDGLRVVVDCANGAALAVAPDALGRARRRRSTVLHAAPDGTNINAAAARPTPMRCSGRSSPPAPTSGLAFDGDADRVIAVDETGAAGRRRPDHRAVRASTCHDRGGLAGDTVVVTVMTNLGFRLAMADAGHRGRRDRRSATATCSRRSSDRRLSLGGEQSGHVIFRDLATTGDGLLTGTPAARRRRARPVGRSAELAADGHDPAARRCCATCAVAERDAPTSPRPWPPRSRAEEAELGGRGRVLVRPSGTEPLVRVMVEAPSRRPRPRRVAERLAVRRPRRLRRAHCGRGRRLRSGSDHPGRRARRSSDPSPGSSAAACAGSSPSSAPEHPASRRRLPRSPIASSAAAGLLGRWRRRALPADLATCSPSRRRGRGGRPLLRGVAGVAGAARRPGPGAAAVTNLVDGPRPPEPSEHRGRASTPTPRWPGAELERSTPRSSR